MTLKPILFFDPYIRISAHSATDSACLLGPTTIAEFAGNDMVKVSETDGGEYLVECGAAGVAGYRFMQGPRAPMAQEEAALENAIAGSA